MLPTIELRNDAVIMLDQRVLPGKTRFLTLKTTNQVIDAIKKMVIRGAPAIGIAAAMGLTIGAAGIRAKTRPAWDKRFKELCADMLKARPTAVNLAWAVKRMERLVSDNALADPRELVALLKSESKKILDEDIAANQALGRVGAEFVPDQATILTHCNAGALATGGYGTALGVVRAAAQSGKRIDVIADETRPFLQGARLTAWELKEDGISVRVAPDSMAASLIAQKKVDLVVVGADRIAANGDVANKIGTYAVALAARAHKVPFYVAAPISTIDPDCPSGERIPIEERVGTEVSHIGNQRITPEGVQVMNQAFDVTPASFITAIFTERGVAKPPNRRTIKSLLHQRP